MTQKMRQKRQTEIIAVADNMRHDSMDGQGLDPKNYEPEDLNDVIRNCVGYELSEREHRLAVVAFEQGRYVAKKCIWYENS